MQRIIIIAITLLGSVCLLLGQKTVENIPQKFLSPQDIYDADNKTPYLDYIYADGDVAFNKPWLVISDRDNNKTYRRASTDSGEKGIMSFGEWGYVTKVSEDKEWIKVVRASLNGNRISSRIEKDYGWVRKEKMLLWTSGLVSPVTGINRKGFLLNKMETFNTGKMDEIAPIFKSPNENLGQKDQELYRFYFVYKKEGNRLLLGKEQKIPSKRQIERHLIGWIDRTKITEWNTRIALEPNFTVKGFKERQRDKNKRLVGFGSRSAAEAHATYGAISNILWDNDPSFKNNREIISAKNPRRFKGGVVRFPYLGAEEKATSRTFIRSGVIGHVQQDDNAIVEKPKIGDIPGHSDLEDEIRKINSASKYYNLFFVIEGSEYMAEHKEDILLGIEIFLNTVKSDKSIRELRIGFGVYRDKDEEVHGKMTELVPLTNDHGAALTAIRKMEFNNWKERDQFSVYYYGLKDGIAKANFNKEATTNIIISIGKFADYKAEGKRRDLISDRQSEKTYLEVDDILDDFENLDIHFYSIQFEDIGSKASVYFGKQARNFLLEHSKRFHNKLVGNNKYEGVKPPFVASISGQPQRILASNGINPGFLELPGKGNQLSSESFIKALNDAFDKSSKLAKEVAKWVNIMDKGGEKVLPSAVPVKNKNASSNGVGPDTGDFPPKVYERIEEIKRKLIGKGYSRDQIEKLFSKRIRFYTEVYFPKEIDGAKYSPVSYILYMPRDDLKEYLGLLQEITKVEDKPYHEKKKVLKQTLTRIFEKFAGDRKDVDVEDISSDEFFDYLQGIKEEGLKLSKQQEKFKISEITTLSDQRIDKFIKRIIEKENRLYSIYNNPKFDFKYRSGDVVYYWIPVEDAF